ncbi:MAG: solute carrier family 23 protein [Planctomycetota bacterium]
MNENAVIYGLDDRPPIGRALILALQHVLTMFGSTVAIPLLFGPAMGMDQAQIGQLISSVMLCSGVATLLQSTLGSRLPIIQGVSFSFIGVFFGIIGTISSEGGSAAEMMQYIAGAIIAGGIIEAIVGFTGLMGRLRRLLSPVVVGPVIMLIGLALFQHGAPKAGTDWPISGLTILLITLFSLVFSRTNRVFQLFPILLAILSAVAVCFTLTQIGTFDATHPSFVNLEAFNNSPMVRTQFSEIVFPWGYPKFRIDFAIAALAAYMASMIESFGDYHACSHMAGGGDPTPEQISRGIGCEGIGCMLTGVFGGFSSTSYSENIGLIGLTRVGSRFVVQIGAVLLIALGFFAKFGALAAAIPGPVVGGLYCALFGLISAVGVQQLAKCDLNSNRNLYIAGLALFMGLSVPAYFSTVAEAASIGPGQTLASYTPTAEPMLELIGKKSPGLVGIITSIGTTGMAVAAIIGLVLDNLIPGSDEERGLSGSKT